MQSVALNSPETGVEPGLRSFLDLCERVGFEPEPFQRKIAKAALGPERELVVLEPRGNGKTALTSLISLHHLLSVPEAKIYCVAASVPQARIMFEFAADFARRLDHPNLVFRHLELRYCPDPSEPTVFSGHLRVLGAEAPRLHGLSPTLMVLDELQAVTREGIYESLASALHKRPDSKLIVISTAGQGADSPLGRLRRRGLGLPEVKRRGYFTDARGPGLRMLEWAVPEGEKITPASVKKANPASWITTQQIREQHRRLPEIAYRRFVANQWTGRMGSWLPAGAWQACADGEQIDDGSKVWVGVDIGGARADTAIVWLDEDRNVGCEIWSGEDALMDATAFLPELAKRYRVAEIVYDPWRAQTLAEVAQQHRIKVTAFPQSRFSDDSRLRSPAPGDHRGQGPPSRRREAERPHRRSGRSSRQKGLEDRPGRTRHPGRRSGRPGDGLRGGHGSRADAHDAPGVALMAWSFCVVCRTRIPKGSRCARHRLQSPSSRAWHRPGSGDLREQALERDGHRCQWPDCDDEAVEVHHIEPIADGGSHTLRNLASLCALHHLQVHRQRSEHVPA